MKKSGKRILSICLALIMALSLLPAPTLATETEQKQNEPAGVQTLTLPVIEEGEEGPAPQGAVGSFSLMDLEANQANCAYFYAGMTRMYSSVDIFILNQSTGERVMSKPEANGIVQMLDGAGNVVASSSAVSSYSTEYDYSSYPYTLLGYYISYYTLTDTAEVPAGTYSLQLYAGNTYYPLEGSVIVVDSDSLLINSVSVYDMYPEAASFDLRIQLYGFETEEELDDLTFRLLDGEGVVVAESNSQYRDFSIYESYGVTQWYLYTQMEVAEGQSLQSGVSYRLQINYTGDKTLYDGVGAVTRSAYSPSMSITGFDVLDAQTGLVQLTFQYWDETYNYSVVVRENYDGEILATWQGPIPEDGVLEIQLAKNGVAVPLTIFGRYFYVEVYRAGSTYTTATASFDNPCYGLQNSSGVNVSFMPYYISTSATSVNFTLRYSGGILSAYQGVGDVLVMKDPNGEEVGRCESLTTLASGSSSGTIGGTLTFPNGLSDGFHSFYLNGVALNCMIYVTSDLRMIINFPMLASGENTFYSNLGILPIKINVVNSSGTGRFVIKTAEDDEASRTDVLVGELISAAPSEYDGMLIYSYCFDAGDLAGALTPGESYTFYFRDGSGSEKSFFNVMTYDAEKVPLVLSTNNLYEQYYIRGYEAEVGGATLPIMLYFYNDGALRNLEESDLEVLKGITLTNTTTSAAYTVTGYENGIWSSSWDTYTLNLTLNQTLTAGSYTVYYNGTALTSFILSEPSETVVDTTPRVYNSTYDALWGYIEGVYLPTDSDYTAKLFDGYTCLTPDALALTLFGEANGDVQRLTYSTEAVDELPLKPGEYELRIYQDGKLFSSVTLNVVDRSQTIVSIRDISYSSALVNRSGYVRFTVYNANTYVNLRAAETEEALAQATYYPISSNRAYALSQGEGEKTFYAQLQDADGTESEVYTFKLWRLGEDGLMDIFVPDDIQGVYGESQITFSVGAEAQYVEAWMELQDTSGSVTTTQLSYNGFGELPELYPAAVYGLESDHPCAAGTDKTWTYTVEDAESIEVTFSPATSVSSGRLYIYAGTDITGTLVGSYSSSSVSNLAGQTITVPGDSVTIRLYTYSYAASCYGFAVTSIVDPDAPVDPEDTADYKYIFNKTYTTSTSPLPDNEYVRFYLTDEAGRVISETVERLLIFGNPATVILPQFRNTVGTVYVTDNAFSIYGYATAFSTVTATEGETTLGSAIANENGYFSIELTGLAEGRHSVTVADDSGVTAAATANFVVDTIAPVIQSINFNFGDGDDATIRWECSDSDIDYFRIFKNDVLLGSYVSSSSRTYSVAASMDDGNYFTIQAFDLAGNMGSKTVSTADQEPPTAPETLTVTGVTTTTAALEWSEGTDNIGILGYNVYVDGEEVARLTGDSTLTYTVTGLEPGEEYTFTVKTRDKAGNTSEDSPAATVSTVKLTIDGSSLEDSYIVDEFAAYKQIPVSFSVTADQENYSVSLRSAVLEYRPAGSDETAEWTSVSLNKNSGYVSGYWPISGSGEDGYLPMGEYNVRFTVTDSYGAVASSETTQVVLLKRDDVAPTVPGTPAAVSHSTTAVTFQWTASTDNIAVDHYEVYRDGVKVADCASTSYTDTGLEMGESYSYTVKAVDARGNASAASGSASLNTMVLEFDSVISLEDSYILEEQTGKAISIWAKFNPEEGYVPNVTMTMEYQAAGAETWTSVPLTASAGDSNTFTGSWSVAGDELGYLPVGSYTVRFAVTDGSATAYSASQTVTLEGEKTAPVVTSLSANGATLSGKAITLTASAADNVGVTRIVFSYAASGSAAFTEIAAVETTAQAEYTWDASAVASGVYTIKAEAYDARGNVGEKTISLTIDTPPPAAPTGLTVTPTSRYIHVMWDTAYDRPADFAAFHVYRATSQDGPYTEMFNQTSVGYYDDGTTAVAGVTYYYYVTATDQCGNESAPTEILSATFVNDTESPVIGDMLPREDEPLRKETTLQVSAVDNYRLSAAIFFYRAAGTAEWTFIGETAANEITNNTVFSLNWEIPTSLAKGTYEIKAEVYDASYTDLDASIGYVPNAPAVITRTVTIYPYSAPAAPVVTATEGYKTANLSWTYDGDTATLRQFTVYQTDAGGASRKYVTAVKAGADGSCDVTIPAEGEQYFVVVAQDVYGASAASGVTAVTSLPGESEPPVAVILPETLTAATGIPFTFSGVNSTDNDVIASYAWTFGDGETGSEAECQHTYAAAGTYTVTLTVTDASGNSDTATAAMKVYDVSGADATHALMTLHVVNAYVEGTPGIDGADVKIYTEDGSFETGGKTDASGVITAVVPVGAVTVAVTADGFIATSRAVTVEPENGGAFTYTVGMTPMNVSLVDGSLTVKEMTYDEIVAAGIDVTNPANNHVWKFAAVLKFVAAPAFPYDLPSLPIEGYFNGEGAFLGGSGWGWTFFGPGGFSGSGGSGSSDWGGIKIGIFPISENFVLVIYGEAHWLKEMYNVELVVINNSYVDDITDCEATLTLPEGLSLAAMTGEAQSGTIEIGTIPHKTSADDTANTTKVNWYVRGDAEGEYYLTATVTGKNPEPFVKEFTTDKPIKVYAGSALKLSITAEDIAYRGEEYHVRFKLENVSDKELYNLSFGITGAEQFRVVEYSDGTSVTTQLTEEDFGSSMTRSIQTMKPGDSITIDFYTTIWFNSLLELADLGPFDVGYYLTNVFVTTLEGSTTTIPYEVNIVHVPHGSFSEFVWEQVQDGVVDTVTDLIDDTVFYGIPVTGTMSKAYEIKVESEDDENAASHATITIENGRFTSSENVLTVYGLDDDESAIVVYTDAPEKSYTISEDGKTMTLNTSAKIYVEGAADGVGTMTVTTYTYNSQSEEYDSNVYTLEYTVDMDGSSGAAADVILQAPAQTTLDVPLAGETLAVTFPYRLLDENGGFLLDAANAEWSVSGEDTTGLSIDKGVLTIEPTAKAGTYTVTLTAGDKSASQPFTLTRKPSVATQVKICRNGVELDGSDVLHIPVSGSLTYSYTAVVIDQYGVAFETDVTWTSSDGTSTDGIITLDDNSASGSLTLTAVAGGKSASVGVVTIREDSIAVDTVSSSDTGAVVSLTNSGEVAVAVQGIVAAYDGAGRMIACQAATVNLAAGNSANLSLSYSDADEVATIRVFVLNAATDEPLKETWSQTVSSN